MNQFAQRSLALVVLLGSLIACSDDNSPRIASVRAIGPEGGTLTVTSGELAGLRVDVPAGAVSDLTAFAVRTVPSGGQPGFADLGPAAEFTPAGLVFDPAATMRLPFDPNRLPFGSDASMVVVLRRDASGAVSQIVPTSVDVVNGIVTLPMDQTGTYWVAVPAAPRVTTDYFPFNVGDVYNFDDNTQIVLSMNQGVAPLPNVELLNFEMVNGTSVSGFLLERANDGSLIRHADYDTGVANDFLEVHSMPEVFIPGNLVISSSTTRSIDYTSYVFSMLSPVFSGTQEATTSVEVGETVVTPLDTYEDTLLVELLDDRSGDPSNTRSETDRVRIWLARGLGPVQVQINDDMPKLLVAAFVDGGKIIN